MRNLFLLFVHKEVFYGRYRINHWTEGSSGALQRPTLFAVTLRGSVGKGGTMLGPIRYRIVGMIFLLALINHIDRANISIAAPVMIRELVWDEARFGIIFSA